MTIHIVFGWWLLPLAFSLLVVGIGWYLTPVNSGRGGYLDGIGEIFVLLIEIIALLLIWLVYFVVRSLT